MTTKFFVDFLLEADVMKNFIENLFVSWESEKKTNVRKSCIGIDFHTSIAHVKARRGEEKEASRSEMSIYYTYARIHT